MNIKIFSKNKLVHFTKLVFGINSPAFTLIELLVVIAVISLLASVILVATNYARSKGRDTQRVANVAQVSKALELYFNNHNAYPTGTYYSGWDAGSYSGSDHNCWCQSTTTNNSLKQALVGDGYINKLPEDPMPQEGDGNYLNDGQGRGFLYVSVDGQSYVLGTYLETTKTAPPVADTPSSCMAAGNYQINVGSLTGCPALAYTVGGGSGPPPPAPTISGGSPYGAAVGTTITISGTGFTASGNSVTMGTTVVGSFSSSDGTTIAFTNHGGMLGYTSCTSFHGATLHCAYPTTVTNANGTSNTVSVEAAGF